MLDIEGIINEVDGRKEPTDIDRIVYPAYLAMNELASDGKILGYNIQVDDTSSKDKTYIVFAIKPISKFRKNLINLSKKSYDWMKSFQ